MTLKVTRGGRIVFWPGASLWALDVQPHLEVRSNRMHSHHAFQLTFSVAGTVGIHTASGIVPGPLILTAPDTMHAIEPEGRIVLIFVEPESRAGAALERIVAGHESLALGDVPDLRAEFAPLWNAHRPSDREVSDIGLRVLRALLADTEPEAALDARIARVLERLTAEDGGGVTAAEAAGIACLSESRFSHLFVAQVGLPFRTYLLWKRLTRAVERIAEGDQLTAAAHHAGFADSSHFSRTFNRMFGLPAAALELDGLQAALGRSDAR